MDLHIGQRVRHRRHGTGTISSILGLNENEDGVTVTAVMVTFDGDDWPHFGRPVGTRLEELEVVDVAGTR